MRNLVLVCMVSASLGFAARAMAVDPPEKSRTVCDEKDPKNNCPTVDPKKPCVCTPDIMEIVFDRDGTEDSVFGYDPFAADTAVNVTVMMDVKTNGPDPGDGVQGWSYGVAHEDAFLTLSAVTIIGTDAEPAKAGGFGLVDMKGIETCAAEPAPGCKNPQAGADGQFGFISAIILSFMEPVELKTGRNTLAKANYKLKADAGATGTLIKFSDRLKKHGSPPADINITVNGISKVPVTVIDGLVVNIGGGPCVPTGKEDTATAGSCTDGKDNDCDTFIDAADPGCTAACVPTGKEDTATAGSCTDGKDNDCDTFVDAADPGCVAPSPCEDYAYYFGPAATKTDLAVGAATEFVITSRNLAASTGFQLGVKSTKAGATTTWDFAGTLGTDANRLIELLIVDDQGNSKPPAHPNKATSSTDVVSDVKRGAAIAGFSTKNDTLLFDLAPGVGGSGFTVGYVADLTPPQGGGNKIPATGVAVGGVCPVNEILKVTLGGQPPVKFSRGDANGDSKINVTDAVLIIQIVVGNLAAKFTCQDILDANDDGKVNVTDALPVLAYVFQKGPALLAPFRVCGDDATADTLVCTQSNCQ